MAIHFNTVTPKRLLATYKRAIDDGHITTWSYDIEGDFTHTVDQWSKKAWLRPKIREREELILYILGPRGTEISSTIYAIYHGRFIESMLIHCDKLFVEGRASAMPEAGDIVSA